MNKKRYDAVIFGSGGGAKLAEALAKRGLKVALIEKGKMGGTCLNRGCIPSKMLIHSAETALTIQKAYLQNIKVSGWSCHFKALVERVCDTVDAKSNQIRKYYKKNSEIDLYTGKGEFVSSNTIRIGKKIIRGDRIFLSTGTAPYIPPIKGLIDTPYITSTEALRLSKLPKHIAIVGGGYIAAELGFYFSALGSQVTLLARKPSLLVKEDLEIQSGFVSEFSKQCHLLLKTAISQVTHNGKLFSIHYEEGSSGKQKILKTEALLIATGLVPNTSDLQLQNTQIACDDKGFILVDSHLRTKDKNVWAFGDCTGAPFLRHLVNYEVEYLIDTLFDKKKRNPIDYEAIPHAIFSYPEVASIGKTEQQLTESKTPFVTGMCRYQDVARGLALRFEPGFVKLLFCKKTKTLLGAHLLGQEAATLCHILIPFFNSKATAEDIFKMIYIHPALPEVIREAAKKAFASF